MRVSPSSVVQLCDQSNTTLDPVLQGVALLHWQLNHQHEVGRVTGRRQGAASV